MSKITRINQFQRSPFRIDAQGIIKETEVTHAKLRGDFYTLETGTYELILDEEVITLGYDDKWTRNGITFPGSPYKVTTDTTSRHLIQVHAPFVEIAIGTEIDSLPLGLADSVAINRDVLHVDNLPLTNVVHGDLYIAGSGYAYPQFVSDNRLMQSAQLNDGLLISNKDYKNLESIDGLEPVKTSNLAVPLALELADDQIFGDLIKPKEILELTEEVPAKRRPGRPKKVKTDNE